MQLTEQQVLALAPDSSSANNGKKLAQAKQWPTLGQSGRSLWGECQGSGSKPYQVRVDLADFASKCSCPSHKFPCKHALGLLVLAANQPAALTSGTEPEWVAEWLDKRADTAARKEARAVAKAEQPVDEEAQRKRSEKRDVRVREAIGGLQLWLEDLVRNGLARLPAEGPALWDRQSARLVDGQAPGLAAKVKALAEIPGSGDDWAARLLAELGKLALASRAYERIEQLPLDLQQALRQTVGFSVKEEEVLAAGDITKDRWQVIGQHCVDADRVRVQRTWVIGEASRRKGLLLQFAAGGQTFGASWVPGTSFEAELAFYPGAGVRRALVKGSALPAQAQPRFAEACDITALLDEAAVLLAANPWHERHAAVLSAVVPVLEHGRWHVVDADGNALPLARGEHWLWLALSGGHAHDVAVEWDGEVVLPLGAMLNGTYFVLTGRTT